MGPLFAGAGLIPVHGAPSVELGGSLSSIKEVDISQVSS